METNPKSLQKQHGHKTHQTHGNKKHNISSETKY